MTVSMSPREQRGIIAVRAESKPGDIKALMDELRATVSQFKTANDERLSQVEKGLEDAVTVEKVDKINAEISSVQDKLDTAMKDLAHLQVGGAGVDPDAKAKAELQARMFFAGKRGVEDERITEADIEGYGAYAQAFPKFLRRGQTALNTMEIQAAMQVGSDPDGGYWVPTQMAANVIQRLFETSPMRQVADMISITTDSVEWPNDTNDATTGGWVGETETRSETATPEVGTQTIYVREQYAMPIVTQKLLDMSSIDVEGWLTTKIADKLSRTENTAFVSGTGVKQPRGFLDYKSGAVTTDDASRAWGALQYVPSGAAGGFPTVSGVPSATDADALMTIVSKINPAYRAGAVWMMSRAVEATIRKFKDGDGNYLIGGLQSGATGFSLLGFPIVTAEDMPALAGDSFSVAFGNFGVGYQIVDGRGIRVLRDNLTTKGKVKFYTTKWTGGDVLNFDAIKLMKFATS